MLGRLKEMADLGIHVAHGRIEGVQDIRPVEILGEAIVPAIADW
jgi:hypothetical protein